MALRLRARRPALASRARARRGVSQSNPAGPSQPARATARGRTGASRRSQGDGESSCQIGRRVLRWRTRDRDLPRHPAVEAVERDAPGRHGTDRNVSARRGEPAGGGHGAIRAPKLRAGSSSAAAPPAYPVRSGRPRRRLWANWRSRARWMRCCAARPQRGPVAGAIRRTHCCASLPEPVPRNVSARATGNYKTECPDVPAGAQAVQYRPGCSLRLNILLYPDLTNRRLPCTIDALRESPMPYAGSAAPIANML